MTLAIPDRPLPLVGDQLRQHFGDLNVNNWKCWADVLAVVEGRAGKIIVVERWLPVKQTFSHEVIDELRWRMWGDHYQHRRGKRRIGLDGAFA